MRFTFIRISDIGRHIVILCYPDNRLARVVLSHAVQEDSSASLPAKTGFENFTNKHRQLWNHRSDTTRNNRHYRFPLFSELFINPKEFPLMVFRLLITDCDHVNGITKRTDSIWMSDKHDYRSRSAVEYIGYTALACNLGDTGIPWSTVSLSRRFHSILRENMETKIFCSRACCPQVRV